MIKKNIFFVIFLLLPWLTFSQTKSNNSRFDHLVFAIKGDLNKDNIADSVVVVQDTLDNISPYRLKIYLAKPDRKYFLSVQSDSAIGPEFPDGKDGYRSGYGLIDITITSGILSINCELTRGHYEHKFRYKKGNFDLIGYTKVYSDGQGIMYTTDYNLSTGLLLEISERYDTEKVLSNKRKVVKVKDLPMIQDFKPFSTDIY